MEAFDGVVVSWIGALLDFGLEQIRAEEVDAVVAFFPVQGGEESPDYVLAHPNVRFFKQLFQLQALMKDLFFSFGWRVVVVECVFD